MSNKASMVCATALIAAVTLVSTGLALFILPAMAEDSLATILAPADGAKLETKHTYKLEYEVTSSAKVDDVHLC
jgi:hypothetical protein